MLGEVADKLRGGGMVNESSPEKTAPEPLYLVFPDEAALPRIGLALSRAYLPEAGVRDLVALARSGHG